MDNYQEYEYDIDDRDYAKMDKCIPQEMEIRNVRLAAAYVPFQKFCKIFSPIEALKKGTIFPELYSPYDKKDKKQKIGWPK